MDEFLVARNPDSASTLPYLLHLPIEGGTWLKARETWPRSARVYCHPSDPPDLASLEVLERVAVHLCARRGPAIDLVLARGNNKRSQFVFTAARGRSLILWQTPRVATTARPGLRIPFARPDTELAICVDTREKYGYKFGSHVVTRRTCALRVGDYAVMREAVVLASVERKTLEGFTASLNDGTLNYAMAELSALPASAVVVEGPYSALLKHAYTKPGYIVDAAARLQVRYPKVPIVYLESRKLAEEWTYRFLRAAHALLANRELQLSALDIPLASESQDCTLTKSKRKRAAQKP